jgi:hypothetical protein
MSRQEQVAALQQKLSQCAALCANPYVSIRIQILELPFDAPLAQVRQLSLNAALLEQNPYNLEAWQQFQELSK